MMVTVASGSHNLVRSSKRISHDLFDLRENVLSEIDFQLWMLIVQVGLIVAKTKFVSRFEATILIRSLLNCIICQMNQLVGKL